MKWYDLIPFFNAFCLIFGFFFVHYWLIRLCTLLESIVEVAQRMELRNKNHERK